MSQQNGYIGRSPGDSAVIIASQTFEPTGIQTDFTFASGYDPGYIDVYFNGARLVYANDYTATNGSTVGLTTYANNGDVLELVAYKAFNLGNISESPGNFSVGNQLTVVGTTTATRAYYTGVVTATSFSGDGSSLTGIGGTDNIITGVAVTIGGILRVTDTTQSTSSTTGAVIVSGGVGIAKSLHVGGNVTVGGTITYEDVTNQDVIGLSTFRSGVQFGLAGVGGTIAANGNTTLAGVVTATSFSGSGANLTNLSGTAIASGTVAAARVATLNQNTSGTAGGLTGTPNITVGAITASNVNVSGITTVGILTAYESITVKVGTGSTELTSAIKTNTTNIATKASTGKAIAMAMVFG